MKVKEESENVGLKLNIQKTKYITSDPITSWQIDGEIVETVSDFIFLGSKITKDGDCNNEIRRRLLFGSRQHIKKQRHYFVNKDPSSQGYGFSSSRIWMWYLDYKESWAPKNWCFCIVVLEKTLESPLDCNEIQPVRCKGDQSWVFIGRTDVEAETSILLPADAKSWLIWKDPHAGKIEVRRKRDGRRWDCWMASLSQRTWVWVNSRSWWWTGRPGVLWFMGPQRLGHNWVTQLTDWVLINFTCGSLGNLLGTKKINTSFKTRDQTFQKFELMGICILWLRESHWIIK